MLGRGWLRYVISRRWTSVRSLLDGDTNSIEASAIVTATTNIADNNTERALSETDIRFHVIGDSAAPRSAAYAFHDGHKVGISL